MKKVKSTCVLGVTAAEANYSPWTKGKDEGLRPLAGLTLNCCSNHSHSGLSAELPRNSTYFYLLECGLKTTVLLQPSHFKNVEKLEAQRQEMPKVSGLVNGQAGVRAQII